VSHDSELLLVMEYVHGEPLQALLRTARTRQEPVPLRIVLAIASAMLHGLHAAHEARSETGVPLGIVHRDVSPQNVMIGADGVPRVLDFGIARAAMRVASTAVGVVKGKLAYMAPEQLGFAPIDRRADVYAASVVLWEMLTGKRLFVVADGGTVDLDQLVRGAITPPSRLAAGVPRLLDAIVLHGLARDPERRFATAREMALALERAGDLARSTEIADWVESLAGETLAQRAQRVADIERKSSSVRLTPVDPADRARPIDRRSDPRGAARRSRSSRRCRRWRCPSPRRPRRGPLARVWPRWWPTGSWAQG
jgi:serine/threonine-protein kinase